MLNEVFGNVELSEAEMQTLIWLVNGRKILWRM